MRNKKITVIFFVLIIVIAAVVFWQYKTRQSNTNGEMTEEIKLSRGTIINTISTTGTVLPKNRLEVKPPVSGRVDEILVQEGDMVKTGQILAWMSSTERAALLDAARGQGEEALKYWKEVYKAIPLISPIDGEVIVEITQPGQTVLTSDAVVVLSDKLIVRAEVDETDIGKITLDMKANITLDAYPDIKIKAVVDHIYYESQTVNNVTIYLVDLIPQEVSPFFRSGMNASVDFITQNKENILVLPVEAVHKNKEDYVLVKKPNETEPVQTVVKLGITDDKNVEIISGVGEDDLIIMKSKKYSLPQDNNGGSNPFMPFGRRQGGRR